MDVMENEPDRASTGTDSAPSEDSASKQPKTFHPFPRLPQEIKDMIWKIPIRPTNKCGVQRFSIVRKEFFQFYHDSESESESECDEKPGHDLDTGSNDTPPAVRWAKPFDSRTKYGIKVVRQRSHRRWGNKFYYFLAAPRVPGSSSAGYSWKYPASLSTYTWDMGLWQASRASRDAMMKHYNPTFWARKSVSFTEEDEDRTPFYLSDAPVLALSDEGGETLPILTHPNTDLFIFDFKDFSREVRLDQVFDNISDMIGKSKSTQSYKGVRHIGFQYNSQLWADSQKNWLYPEDGDFGALMRLLGWAVERRLEDKPAPYIWLIEERLWRWEKKIRTTTRIPGRDIHSKPQKFHEIDGKIYTETNESNLVYLSDKEGVLSYPSAHQFMLCLNDKTQYLEPVDEDRFLDLDPDLTGGSDWNLQPYAGFLTCKTLDPKDPKNSHIW